MKLLKIKNIKKDFIIEAGKIYSINIENARFYYSLIASLLEQNDDFFIFSENYEVQRLNKNILVIDNLFNINPNNKKIINALYKRISSKILTSEDKECIQQINSNILDLLQKISLDLNIDISYSNELDIANLLSIYNFCFKTECNNIIEAITTYIRANLEISNFSCVFSIGLISLLNNNEIELLSKELEYLGLTLININFIQKEKDKLIDLTTIDDDLCEF